jgi:hypothetical protein
VHPNNRRLVHTNGPSRQLRSHAIVQHAAVPNAATRGGWRVSVHAPHAAIYFPEPSCRALQFLISRSVWQAEEAVANLPVRLAVRVRWTARRATRRVLTRHSPRVL